MSPDFIQTIKERGFVHQFTDEEGLRTLLKTPGQRAYIGFDCTAPSLHVGSLLQIMLLRWWQKCGHQPIVLLGGGTTKIGDPSGKDESRPPLTDETINENMNSLKQVFSKFIEFGKDKAIMVNNDDWLKNLNYVTFLRDYGRHFSVNRMLTMDSVKLRLERDHHLSFLEFNYMILQAYDFVELHRKYNCCLQMGGADQWGNIVNGLDLGRKMALSDKYEGSDESKDTFDEIQQLHSSANISSHGMFGLTSPLITTASGAKMGKTAAGAVWLDAAMVSPYDYWQYWRNTEDADVERFLKLFTELSLADIAALMKGNINAAKEALATEATALLHGRAEAEKSAQTARDIFSGKGVSENMPTIHVPAGTTVVEVLNIAGFSTSNSEARRLIKGKGVKVNDGDAEETMKLEKSLLTQEGYIKVSAGKKRHVLVRLK